MKQAVHISAVAGLVLMSALMVSCSPQEAVAKEPAKKVDKAPVEEPAKERGAPEKVMPKAPRTPLTDPTLANEDAPAKFRVKFATSKGDIVIEAVRDWAPNGVDRFYHLVKIGYFQDLAFFRCVPKFIIQFGIHGDPGISAVWSKAKLTDDPRKQSNLRGYISYAKLKSADSRSTQLFINLKDNAKALDKKNFVPIAKIVEGMDVVDQLNTEYGALDKSKQPKQAEIKKSGNAYLRQNFPRLDYIKSATLMEG